jgi:peptide deformylase
MIRRIVRDEIFLQRPSTEAGKEDLQTGMDLLDTLHAHQDICAGMAANMIGVSKNIIVMNAGLMDVLMFNPVIISGRNLYETEEGCLSLEGKRKTKRYRSIKVKYEDMHFHKRTGEFGGFAAEIIQHEVDHCRGILI